MARTNFLIAFFAIFCGLLVCNDASFADVYWFGEDGENEDLYNDGPANGNWMDVDDYYIVGNCNIPDGCTITVAAGVEIVFWDLRDGDDDGETEGNARITVFGTLDINGTEANPVEVIEEDGINDGFDGIVINGSGINDGIMTADWTVFDEGGEDPDDDAIICTTDDANLKLRNCIIRNSDSNGVKIGGDDAAFRMYSCEVNDNTERGVITDDGDGSGAVAFIIDGSYIHDNGDGGVKVERPGQKYIINQNRFDDNDEDPQLSIGDKGYGEITNNIVWDGNNDGIVFTDDAYCVNAKEYKVYNNVCYDNTWDGIHIADLDYSFGGDYLVIHMRNNILWSNDDDGLHVGGWNDEDWPQDNNTYELELLYNIFGDNNHYEVRVHEAGDTPAINEFNAFEDDDVENCTANNCIIDGEDDALLTLVSEVDPYDFHIEWDGANSLINVTNDADHQDPDLGWVDVGVYGGPGGDDCIDEDGDAVDNYILLGAGDINDNLTIPGDATYRVKDDFTVPENFTYTIGEGAYFGFYFNKYIDVEGTLVTQGVIDNHVHFDALKSYGWEGIRFRSTSEGNDLDFTDIDGAHYSNYNAIRFYAQDAGLDPSNLDDITIDETDGWAVYAYGTNTTVNIDGMDITNANYGGVRMVNSDGNLEGITIDNTGDGSGYSASMTFYGGDCNPVIGGVADADEIDLDNGDAFGLNIRSSSTPDMDAGDGGTIGIQNMGDHAIYIEDGCRNTPFQFNNIVRTVGHYAVYNDFNPGNEWIAENCWWGTADADDNEDSLFYIPSRMDYDPWEAGGWIDNETDYYIARAMRREKRFADAIPHFESVLEYDENMSHKIIALKYLRSCIYRSGEDMEDFQDICSEMISDFPNTELADVALIQSISSLSNLGQFEEKVTALQNIRDHWDNEADSLRNEIRILLAQKELEDISNIQVDSYDEIDIVFEEKLEKLDDKIRTAEAEGKYTCGTKPSNFCLNPAYPNPFNATTKVTYSIDEAGKITVLLYDANGRMQMTLLDGVQNAGNHSLTLNAADLPSGSYFLKLTKDSDSILQPVVLVK